MPSMKLTRALAFGRRAFERFTIRLVSAWHRWAHCLAAPPRACSAVPIMMRCSIGLDACKLDLSRLGLEARRCHRGRVTADVRGVAPLGTPAWLFAVACLW